MVAFQVQQKKFEGPLALLLELIEKEKLAIAEISLAKVADDYLVYVRALSAPDPEELAEFLVIAAHLMLIKSRTLLPQLVFSEEEEASIGDLEQRLSILQVMREAAREMQRVEQRGMRIASREAYAGIEPVFHPPHSLAAANLASVFGALIALIPKAEALVEEKLKRIVSLEERISHIKSILQNVLERGFSEIMLGVKERMDIILSFLAVLELARQKFIDLRQEKAFDEILIRKVL